MGNHAQQALRNRRLVCALLAMVGAALTGSSHAQAGRDNINIVGSSTVFPFAIVVAENFGRRNPRFNTPKIEPTGSGGGIKAFCGGVGIQHPDIANSSRRITAGEVADCNKNGVTQIVEVKIGYDGIVLANAKSSPHYQVTLRDVYLALAKEVPDPAGTQKLVPNPYTKWSEINSSLPADEIDVLGPPPTSGTRDAFNELVMEGGCKTVAWVAALPRDQYLTACHMSRDDGHYTDAGENDNLIVQKLVANPRQLGVFGYSFLEQNADKVQGAHINGVEPDFDSIADGTYPVSRPLYFYVKKAHVGRVPGIREYVAEFTSDAAVGEFGYLTETGLIPLANAERAAVQAQAKDLVELHLGSH
ncbi:MAG TPA: substrate-binding domain-containing protein [Gammaproteobacteria bacterium]|nr:substrate-binding domain-containing protein [Gammaproteobacteria bacterium]